jgi:hypothetical protein
MALEAHGLFLPVVVAWQRRPTALRAIPGAGGVEIRGDTVLIHCGGSGSDAVARRLLTQTPARDLEITSRGLEDAFLALTGDGAGGPSDRNQAAT